jgi:hypothetical protein
MYDATCVSHMGWMAESRPADHRRRPHSRSWRASCPEADKVKSACEHLSQCLLPVAKQTTASSSGQKKQISISPQKLVSFGTDGKDIQYDLTHYQVNHARIILSPFVTPSHELVSLLFSGRVKHILEYSDSCFDDMVVGDNSKVPFQPYTLSRLYVRSIAASRYFVCRLYHDKGKLGNMEELFVVLPPDITDQHWTYLVDQATRVKVHVFVNTVGLNNKLLQYAVKHLQQVSFSPLPSDDLGSWALLKLPNMMPAPVRAIVQLHELEEANAHA